MRKYLLLILFLLAALAMDPAVQIGADELAVEIVLESGIYTVNWHYSSLERIIIRGSGMGTVLRPDALDAPALLVEDCGEVVIENLTVQGRYSEGATSSPIQFLRTGSLTVRGLLVEDAYMRGVDVYAWEPGHGKVIIEDSEFQGMHRNAMYIGMAERVWVRDNLIHDAPDVAIDVGFSSNVHIVDNTVESAQTGIGLYNGSQDAVIRGNVLDGIAGNGIVVQNSTDWIVADNLIRGGQKGMHIEADCGTVSDNRLEGFALHGLRIFGPDVLVTGNSFAADGADSGIFADGDRLAATENVFIGTMANGIKLNGTSGDLVHDNRFEGVAVPIRLLSSEYGHLMGNVFVGTGEGMRLQESSYNLVEANACYETAYNNSIVETGSADYNRIRRNLVKNQYSVVVIGPNTVAVDNDW